MGGVSHLYDALLSLEAKTAVRGRAASSGADDRLAESLAVVNAERTEHGASGTAGVSDLSDAPRAPWCPWL